MATRARSFVVLIVGAVVAGLLLGGTLIYFALTRQPAPWSNSCTATVGSSSIRLEPVQVRNASIIAGVGLRRGLSSTGVTIALATAMQESGLRNLDYGDRDSLGLFQQRPSQGWGTAAQVQDPYYAADAFYDAMVKVKGWQTMDVGDVAQEVQRSGYPDAYDKRVAGARTLASALTGETPAALTCSVSPLPQADAAGLGTFLTATLPDKARVKTSGKTITVDATDSAGAWAASSIAVANMGTYGISTVGVNNRTWRYGWPLAAGWSTAQTSGATSTRVVVTLG